MAVSEPIVAEPPVIDEKIEETALKIEAKKLVVVALPATSEDEYKFVEVELVMLPLVAVRPVEKKLVVVADVPVALMKVKFWRVVEPIARRSPAWLIENLVVEATFKSIRLPVKPVSASVAMRVVEVSEPATESLANGDEVAIPTFAPLSIKSEFNHVPLFHLGK